MKKSKIELEGDDIGFNSKHRVNIDKPDARDYIAEHVLGKEDDSNLPESIVWMTEADNQGNSVKCTTYGSYHVGKILNEIERMKKLDVDPDKGWELQKGFGTYNSSGDYVQTALKSIVKNGVYLADGSKMLIDGYLKIYAPEAKYWLAKGYPIVTSATVTSTNFAKAKSTGIWGGNSGTVKGGHCISIIGYEPGYFIALNSYGKTWGKYDNGTFKIKEEDFDYLGTCYIVHDHKDIQMIFKDFSSESAWKKEVLWALENGIITGVGESDDPKERLLKPNEPLTRLQAILVMYRFAKLFYNH